MKCFVSGFILALLFHPATAPGKEKKPKPPSPLEVYVHQAQERAEVENARQRATGSLFTDSSPLETLASDLRARRTDDIVTILVSERASAVSKGTTKSARNSSAKTSIDKLAGVPSSVGGLRNLIELSGASSLDGTGATTRQSTLTTTLTARVVDVLPNGFLVVEGSKSIVVNSENQVITLRGVVRPYDLTTANVVPSERVAQMEVMINGQGVVNDAIRRPNILYRLLLGLLPF